MTISEKQLSKIRKNIKEVIDDTTAHINEWDANTLDDRLVKLIGYIEPLMEYRDDIQFKLNEFQDLKTGEGKPVNATDVMVRANPLFQEIMICGAQLKIADYLIRTMQNRQYLMAVRIKQGIDG